MPLCSDTIYREGAGISSFQGFHVVVTRYNLVIENFRSAARVAKPSFNRNWLDHRLELFKAFCLPSMLEQVKRPDLWLLEFDGESRQAVEPVLAAVRAHSWIVPAWQNRVGECYEDRPANLRREVLPRLAAAHTHVLSTRLDSDDALHSSFLDDLAKYSAAVLDRSPQLADYFVSFPFGAKYSWNECRLYVYPANPFLSRVQRIKTFTQHPSIGDHTNALERGRVYLPLTTEPMWVQVVHGRNVRNRQDQSLPVLALAETQLARCGVSVRGKALRRIVVRRRGEPTGSVRQLAKKVLRGVGLLPAKQSRPTE